jgi:1,4-dihydroxy-2-naphthoate octaprenyltransferase
MMRIKLKDTGANKFYLTAMVLTVLWITGFLFYDFGPVIHLLLILAFFIIFIRIILDK